MVERGIIMKKITPVITFALITFLLNYEYHMFIEFTDPFQLESVINQDDIELFQHIPTENLNI